MYIETKRYHVVCDECGNELPLFDSESQEGADSYAIGYGWKCEGQMHICDECLKDQSEEE
jgi:hypothetical protein